MTLNITIEIITDPTTNGLVKEAYIVGEKNITIIVVSAAAKHKNVKNLCLLSIITK